MKHFLIGVFILVLIGLAGFYFITGRAPDYTQENPVVTDDTAYPTEETQPPAAQEADATDTTTTETVAPAETTRGAESVLGTSAGGNTITAYHYGNGAEELLFVGGIHGGYSWNTALVAYELMDYLDENPAVIPENLTVTVIPVLNPDGLKKIIGTTHRFALSDVPTQQEATIPGRFNDNTVDLNRNFDCDWRREGTWQNRTVSGGSAAFSEPETAALRDYVAVHEPRAVVAYYSAAGGVFASNCHDDVLLETRTLTNLYANAAGYTAYEEFDFYEITGDMVNWFAKQGVPAISVLLTTHQDVEWSQNQKGIMALLNHYKK